MSILDAGMGSEEQGVGIGTVGTVATGVASVVGGPLAGALVAGGFSVINGILNNISSKKALESQDRIYREQTAKEDERYAQGLRLSRAQLAQQKKERREDVAYREQQAGEARVERNYDKTQDFGDRAAALLNSDRNTRIALAQLIKGRR